MWLLCWTPVNDTGWHDHDISSGAVAVVAGELVENNLPGRRSPSGRRGSVRASRSRSAPTTSTGSTAPSAARSRVHAYSPPLWRMGQYAVDDDGVLRRVSLSYADELRPIE